MTGEAKAPDTPVYYERPDVLAGPTYKLKTGCGNVYVTVNSDKDGRVREVFTQLGKAGGCAASQCEAIGLLVSLALRYGAPCESIIKKLAGLACHKPCGVDERQILSCADAVGKGLAKALEEEKGAGYGIPEK